MNIFCFGSRSINVLSDNVKNKLKTCINKKFTILVGDCYGVDKEIQKYLLENKYYNVIVYHINKNPRNNIGNFITKKINGNRQIDKDIAMCQDCNYFICLYDGKSIGSLRNIKNLQNLNKKGYIFIQTKIKIYTSYFANIKNLPTNIYPISIANIKPKNIEIQEYKKLIPPYNLLMNFKKNIINKEEYKKIYLNYISRYNIYDIIKDLFNLLPNQYKHICLICYEKPDKFCHRHIIEEYFKNIIPIQEFYIDKL